MTKKPKGALCATCEPINQNQTKYKVEIQTPDKSYDIEVKNDLSGLAMMIAFFGIIFLFFTRKKKRNVWEDKKYTNQPYINVGKMSDDNGVVGLFGQRFSQTEQKKLCSPPS